MTDGDLPEIEYPEPECMAWVEEAVGQRVRFLSRFAHEHGYSRLWRLQAGERFLWLKMHGRQDKWVGETHALTHWGRPLGRTPEIVAKRESPYTLLLSEVGEYDAESVCLSRPQAERMWAEAGEWLARMHAYENDWLGQADVLGSPYGATSNDPVEFVRATFDRRLREAIPLNLFSQQQRDFIVGRMNEQLPSLEGERAVAIHRDYTPRNWRVHGDGTLAGVIDFEHARWDVRAADLNRSPDYEFVGNPHLRSAFFEGYGTPSSRLEAQIEILRLQNAVAAIVWGVLVNELDYSNRNRVALERIMAESCQM